MLYATVEKTTRYTENKALTLIGTHTCPKLLFVRKTTMKAMRVPARKCARGIKFVQDCANICIFDLWKGAGQVLELSSKRKVCPAQ
jgi:hypothetical protein